MPNAEQLRLIPRNPAASRFLNCFIVSSLRFLFFHFVRRTEPSWTQVSALPVPFPTFDGFNLPLAFFAVFARIRKEIVYSGKLSGRFFEGLAALGLERKETLSYTLA
ncbi:hypothetical protein [Allobaculum fili]|uniref:hypothetical protein n=1 Tax=Allobaculum fili TaxID=2834460 RepID=UPI001E3FEB0E|nr:hypothetical protein [Allobaculum fili]